jgi:drug/metabolite transporter (DMT)-like permease
MTGIGLIIASAMMFGAITGFSKLLLASAGPATVGALTFFGAGLVGMLATAGAPAARLPAPDRKTAFVFIAASILGAVVAPLLLMIGLQRTSAPSASILSNIEGIATVGFAWLFFRDRSDAISIASVVAILSGVGGFTFAGGMGVVDKVGALLIGAAYLCWAMDVNLMRWVPSIAPAKATAIRGIAGALAMAIVGWLRQEALPDTYTLMAGLLTGALGFGLSFILLLKALPLIGTAKTGAIFAAAPVFGYVCSSVIESGALETSTLQRLSIALIAAGIVISSINTIVRERSIGRISA